MSGFPWCRFQYITLDRGSLQIKLSGVHQILSDVLDGKGSDRELTVIMTHTIYLQRKAGATAQATERVPSCLWGESMYPGALRPPEGLMKEGYQRAY